MHKTKSKILITFMFILFFFSIFKINVSAHNAYFLAVTIDEASNMYRGEIVTESGEKDHKEKTLGSFEHWIDKKAHCTISASNNPLPEADPDKDADDIYEMKDGNKDIMWYTFPSSCSTTSGKETSYVVNATDKDLALVQRVVDGPLAGLNDAIGFIISESGWTSTDSDSIRDLGMQLGSYKSSIKFNGVTFTLKRGICEDGDPAKNYTSKDYITIYAPNHSPKSFIYQCNKGYIYKGKDEPQNDSLCYMGTDKKYSTYTDRLNKLGDVYKMSWRLLVLQGNYNFDNDVTYSNVTSITGSNEFTQTFIGFLNNVLNSIRTFLGLYSIEELMVNTGTRDRNYNLGMFPSSWTNSAVLLHIICQMIAWGMIGFSVIKMLWKKQIATMNVGEKISLQEGIKNLILCGILLSTFTLVFNFLARLNYRLVDLFAASTPSLNLTAAAGASSTLGGIITSFIVFGLSVYFNFFYIVRAVELAILYGIAPLCIYTLSLGGKTAGIFTTFMKNLVGNLYMQTIHAICIAFFSNVFLSSSTKTFEQLVIMYSFIPIGNFIRKKVFGLEEGMGGMVGQQGFGAAAGLAGGALGAAGGILGGIRNKAASGTGKGSGTSDGSLNQAIDSKVSNPSGNADVSMKDGKPGAYNDKQQGSVFNSKGVTVSKNPQDNKDNSKVIHGLTTAAKVAGNTTLGATKMLAGVGMSAINPNVGSQLIKSGSGNISNIGGNIRDGMNNIKASTSFKNTLAKNGVEHADYGKDFASYQIAGNFNKNGEFSSNGMAKEDLNQGNVKDYEAMNRVQSKLGDYNDLNSANGTLTKEDKNTLRYMKQNQVRLHKTTDSNGKDSYKVIRRAEDVSNMNSLDRADPMSGVSIRNRNDNRNTYYNRDNH